MARASILSTGSYVPERIVANDEIAAKLETSADWILDHTGVKERRYARPDEAPAEMAAAAVNRALEAAGLEISDIDFMVAATEHPDFYFPGAACTLQEYMQVDTNVGALDIRAQGAGFVYALSIADTMMAAGLYKKVLVVCPEKNTCWLQWGEDGRNTTSVIGDGAGAVILQASDDPSAGVLSCDLHTDGRYAHEFWVRGDDNRYQPRISHEVLELDWQDTKMNDEVVYQHAVKDMVATIRTTMDANNIGVGDIDRFFPHQINRRVNEAVASELEVPFEKVDFSIERYGNTAAASIPIAIDEAIRGGECKKGDLLLTAAFGAGFMWGSALLRA